MKNISYDFTNYKLLEEALTHPSLSSLEKYDYNRLEFLGDRVLGIVVAEMLFINFPTEDEGDLSKRHIELVRCETLARVAIEIELGSYLIMSEGEESIGGRENNKNLENAMEALIAAIHLDGGFSSAKDFISNHWKPILLAVESPPHNAKSRLQEWAQQRGLPIPRYKIVDRVGAAHCPLFSIEVVLPGFPPVLVKAKNKRYGELKAAELMLEQYILNDV